MTRWTGLAAAIFGTLFVTLVGAMLTRCGNFTEGKAMGDKGVADFHALYNQGKIDDIWKQADPQFRTGAAKQKYEDLMAAMQRKLGKVTSTTNSGWRVRSMNLKTTVLLAQATNFEHGQGTESFLFALNGTNALLAGHNIQSMELVTK